MPTETNYKTFDAPRAVIERFILRKDDKFTEFVKEQALLQSSNALGGRIFNPASFAANFGDYKLTNSTVKQLLFKLGSEVLGADFTTDGKTFARTLDTDIQAQFYDDVYEFKNDFRGDNGFLKRQIIGALNSLGQAINVEVKPSRSIMAQALMYTMTQNEKRRFRDRKKIDTFDGTDLESTSPDVMGEAQYITPDAKDAISYVYGNRLEIDRLRKYLAIRDQAEDGLLAPNFKVPKLRLQKEYEQNRNIKNKVEKKFRTFLRGALRELIDRIFGDVAPLVDDFVRLPNGNVEQNFEYNKSEFAMAYLAKFYSHQFIRPMDENGNVRVQNDGRKIGELYDAQVDSIKRWSVEYMFEELKQDGVFVIDSAGNVTGDRAGTDIMTSDAVRMARMKSPTSSMHAPMFKDVFGKDVFSPYKQHDVLNRYGTMKVRNRTTNFQSALQYSDELRLDDHLFGSDIFDTVEAAEAHVRSDRSKDRVYVLIQDLRTEKTILLHATFPTMTEDLTVTPHSMDYFGRTEEIPAYHKTSRTTTLPLTLYAQTPREFALMYRKIDFIKSLTYPIMRDNFRVVQNPLVRISIGNIYRKIYGFMNSVSTTIDNSDVSWETETGWVAPKKVDITIGLTILHERMPYVPSTNSFMRKDEFDFTMHGVEYERVLEAVSSTLQPIETEDIEGIPVESDSVNTGQKSQDQENLLEPNEELYAQSDTFFLIEHKETGVKKIIQGKDIGKFPSKQGKAIIQLPNKTGSQELNDYNPIAKASDYSTLEAML